MPLAESADMRSAFEQLLSRHLEAKYRPLVMFWGDGSAVETLTVAAGARFFSTTHQYKDDNPTVTTQDIYTVKVRVLDDDSGASAVQSVTNAVVAGGAAFVWGAWPTLLAIGVVAFIFRAPIARAVKKVIA